MAEKSGQPAKKRQLKKVETVRQRADRAVNAEPKARKVQKTARSASRPFKAVGAFIAKIAQPFSFLLWPFKTRPARFIGRFLAKIAFLGFFRDAWREVRKVQWPDIKTTLRLTSAVFIFSIVFGVIIALTDYGLDKIFRKVFVD